ncbi:MAG: indole-3-glycerol-phosphate synthase [Acidimicrobiia bacterium]|nr:indole-3-glycerol-phosphate synthase [Acidimicrobiia bacterium]
MSDFLSTMAESSAVRARAAKASSGVEGLTSRASSARPVIPLQLPTAGFDLIAEAKLASPADGTFLTVGDPRGRVVELAHMFEGAGAIAVSVLTEPSKFDGHMDHLEAAAAGVRVPVLRKDFLVDPIQVVEARAAGASGVLLIARLTDSAVLVDMTDTALGFGMFVLVELFDEADLDRASAILDRGILIGVNTRDLTTLKVDPQRLAILAPLLPDHLPAVAESGVLSAQDAESAALLGYRLALVGTGLVTTEDPAETARAMIAAGRLAATMGSTS